MRKNRKRKRKSKYKIVTPRMVDRMKKLRKKGVHYSDIAKIMLISKFSVHYHLNKRTRILNKKRVYKWRKKLTKKQKKEISKKNYPRIKRYLNKRYHNDEEFRKYYIDLVIKSKKRRKKKWKKKGLCLSCGGKRKDKRHKMCETCRRKSREYYHKNKNLKNCGILN